MRSSWRATPVRFAEPAEAMRAGISMIQQELHPVPARSVMENIWLGRFPRGRFGLVDHDRMRRQSRRLFRDIGVELDPDAKAGDLSVSQVQLMEIARAVSFDARVVIMDEPTSSLSEHEVQRLFGLIDDLRAKGVAVIYISHKLEEVMAISDEVSIMRDGRMIGHLAHVVAHDRPGHHAHGRPRAAPTGTRAVT